MSVNLQEFKDIIAEAQRAKASYEAVRETANEQKTQDLYKQQEKLREEVAKSSAILKSIVVNVSDFVGEISPNSDWNTRFDSVITQSDFTQLVVDLQNISTGNDAVIQAAPAAAKKQPAPLPPTDYDDDYSQLTLPPTAIRQPGGPAESSGTVLQATAIEASVHIAPDTTVTGPDRRSVGFSPSMIPSPAPDDTTVVGPVPPRGQGLPHPGVPRRPLDATPAMTETETVPPSAGSRTPDSDPDTEFQRRTRQPGDRRPNPQPKGPRIVPSAIAETETVHTVLSTIPGADRRTKVAPAGLRAQAIEDSFKTPREQRYVVQQTEGGARFKAEQSAVKVEGIKEPIAIAVDFIEGLRRAVPAGRKPLINVKENTKNAEVAYAVQVMGGYLQHRNAATGQSALLKVSIHPTVQDRIDDLSEEKKQEIKAKIHHRFSITASDEDGIAKQFKENFMLIMAAAHDPQNTHDVGIVQRYFADMFGNDEQTARKAQEACARVGGSWNVHHGSKGVRVIQTHGSIDAVGTPGQTQVRAATASSSASQAAEPPVTARFAMRMYEQMSRVDPLTARGQVESSGHGATSATMLNRAGALYAARLQQQQRPVPIPRPPMVDQAIGGSVPGTATSDATDTPRDAIGWGRGASAAATSSTPAADTASPAVPPLDLRGTRGTQRPR